MGAIIRDPKYRWPNGIIPYVIDPALPDHDRVHRAIQHWEATTVIRFIKKRDLDHNSHGSLTFKHDKQNAVNCLV